MAMLPMTLVMTEYKEEVIEWMFKKESLHSPYLFQSPQLFMRKSEVEFICSVCEFLKLSVTTTHLSIFLLDRFMDSHQISENQLALAALTAILLGAKFEELDSKVPHIHTLNKFVHNTYSVGIFHAMELFMLNYFEWNVGTVTSAHFLQAFSMIGIVPEDITHEKTQQKLKTMLWSIGFEILDLTLRDHEFLSWKASEIAAACLACARNLLCLEPVWPKSFDKLTKINAHGIEPLFIFLQKFYLKKRKNDPTNDSGYMSNSSPVSST